MTHFPERITFAELNAEIDSFQTVITPCEGSEYPWRHFPERITDGHSGYIAVRCACGKVFEVHAGQAPSNQAAPILWASFERFKEHIAALDVPSAELLQFEADREAAAVGPDYQEGEDA